MAAIRFFLCTLLVLVSAICLAQCANLVIGNPAGSSLLYRTSASRNGTTGQYQQQDVVYRGFAVNLTYITAFEVGLSQNANATLVGGGLNFPNATVRLTSALSRGFNYTLEFWGR